MSPPTRSPVETVWYVTVLSNFVRGYDKYSRTYSKSRIPESTFRNQFFLLGEGELEIGVNKARGLLDRLAIPGNRLVALRTIVPAHLLRPNLRTGLGRYIESPSIVVDGVAFINEHSREGRLLTTSIEEVTAQAYQLLHPQLIDYVALKPRTFSVLPIARGCQASCPFCFSNASVSAEQQQAKVDLRVLEQRAEAARIRGAERFVITGGGEPGLVRHELLCDLIKLGGRTLGKTVLITNGHHLTQPGQKGVADKLQDYAQAGLTVLAISRHHHDEDTAEKIMNLRTDVATIARTWGDGRRDWPDLRLRFTCVLQRGAIDSARALEAYVDWAVSLGVPEICFKELYVSTSVESVYYRHTANEWSHANQVPLSLVCEFAQHHGFVVSDRLPWGSPIYTGKWGDTQLQFAAYTEPSLLWERTQGVARSWNLMADGRCLVSLEDRNSEIPLANAA